MQNRRFWLLVAGATAAIMLGCWLSSGTVAPYGTGIGGACDYRFNGDHGHFESVYLMLAGHPQVEWGYSVVLRRILHPLLAYPLMRAFGFEAGGVIFNILAHGVAMIGLAVAFRRYFDARAAVLACWLLASYPGYAYWAGMPYAYALIVPGSIACTIALLWWHDRPSVWRSIGAACVVGFIALGYDLMPYFGGALLLLAVMKRRWRDIPVILGVLGAWAAFIAVGIPAIFGFDALNSNTQTYAVVVNSWLHFWRHLDGWGGYLIRLPYVFVSNFVFSGSITFPILFVVIVGHRLRHRMRPVVGPVGLAILVATLGVFLFLNAAPPYDYWWQMRGTWLARLYQPWFVVVLMTAAAASVALRDTPHYRLVIRSVVACSVLGWLVLAGPYIHINKPFTLVHQNFYQDKSLNHNRQWFRRLGVRPYGICK